MSEEGAPTPVAWTRLCAPLSLMSPSTAETIDRIVAASPLQAKYGTQLDRESAYEVLTERMSRAAEAEREAERQKEEEKADAAARRREETESRRSAPRRRTPSRPAPSALEQVLTSRTTQTVLRGVLEGIFSTRRRR
jgi:hypothetical protein